MAIIEMHYRSNALWRSVPVHVILPIDKWDSDGGVQKGKKFKTLYLLHGLHGDCTEWGTKTRLRRWAEENYLAVVMPAGDNSYYVDRPAENANYGEFIGRELVELTRAMFPLSDKWEDTFIGGLSMGGYGALRNGLKYSDTFSHILCFSGALQNFEPVEDLTHRAYKECLFGDLEKAKNSDMNPRVLAEKLASSNKKPKIYMTCGTEDWLLPWSHLYRDLLTEKGFAVTYEEWPGDHDWDVWDESIRRSMDFLPLK